MVRKKAAARSAGATRRAPSTTRLGRVEFMFETIIDKVNANYEAIYAVRDELRREFKEQFESVHIRLDALEAAVRANGRDIAELKSDVSMLKSDVATLKTDLAAFRAQVKDDIAELRSRLETFKNEVERKANEHAVVALEQRVAALEEHAKIASR